MSSSFSVGSASTQFPANPVSADSSPQKPQETARTPEQTTVLERAAAPKHWGAAIAKKLRGTFSSDAAAIDKLKDGAKSALEAYNADQSAGNKSKFIAAFRALKDKTPPAEIESSNPSWGQTDNPEHAKFNKKIQKLQTAYDIITGKNG